MKQKLLFILLTFVAVLPVSAQCTGTFNIFTEDFEDNGNTLNGGAGRYTSPANFYDPATDDDYFGRVNGNTEEYYLTDTSSGLIANSETPYTGYNGNFFYAGEDMDDTGAPIGTPDGLATKEVAFSGINIVGALNLCFSGLFARGETDGCGASTYDDVDYIKVFYNVDGAGEVLGLQFSANLTCNGDNFNEPLQHDPNMDGNGDDGVALTEALTEFGFNIPVTGTSLALRIETSMSAGSEEIAFDYFRVFSDTATLSVKEKNLEDALAIYPNPSKGLIKLTSATNLELSHATVYDILGKKVKAINLENAALNTTIDLTSLTSGIYIININAKDGQKVTKKLIIK
jgi:hypothetical protein